LQTLITNVTFCPEVMPEFGPRIDLWMVRFGPGVGVAQVPVLVILKV